MTRGAARAATRWLGAVLLGPVLLGGCSVATRGGEGGGSGSGDLAEIKRRVVELQEQARMSEIEIARLRKKVAQLEARLGIASSTPVSRPSAPATPPRTESRTEPRTETRAEPGIRDEAPMLEEIDLESEDLPPSAPPASPARPPSRLSSNPSSSPSSNPTTSSTTAVTPEAQQLYDQGYTLYHRGRYLDAEASFQQFLRAYGATDLADNAQYWIGEARHARGDLQGALSAFRETVERYPRGNKVPDALVKAGQVLEALGDPEGARETYREVVRRFAEAPAAAVARERLDRLP